MQNRLIAPHESNQCSARTLKIARGVQMLLKVVHFAVYCFCAFAMAPALHAQDGATLFRDKFCAVCHGEQGTNPAGDREVVLVDRVADYDFNRFRDIVRTGVSGTAMQPFSESQVSNADLTTIYMWLQSQTAAAPTVPPAIPSPDPRDTPDPATPPPSSMPPAPPNQNAECSYQGTYGVTSEVDAEKYQRGCEIYQSRCVSCHGQNFLGKKVWPPKQKGNVIGRQPIDPYKGWWAPNVLSPWKSDVDRHSPFFPDHDTSWPDGDFGRIFSRYHAGGRPPVTYYAWHAPIPGADLYKHLCQSCHEKKSPLKAVNLANGLAPLDYDQFSRSFCKSTRRNGGGWGYSEDKNHPCCDDVASRGRKSKTCPNNFRRLRKNHLKAIHKYLCEEGNMTCSRKQRVDAIIRNIGPQLQLDYARRQAERANLPKHSYYLALQSGRCRSQIELQQDGMTQVGGTIKKICRAGALRTVRVSRTTMPEAIDPRQRPLDRGRQGGRFGQGFIGEPGEEIPAGGAGTGVIGEPGSVSGLVEIPLWESRCVIPELFVRGPRLDWTCGTGLFGKDGTITCPENATFVSAHLTSKYLRFRCFSGPWDRFLSDLRARNGR